MSTTTAYLAFSTLLTQSNQSISPAELQGVLFGRSCAGAGFDPDVWLSDAHEFLETPIEKSVQQALLGLQAMIKTELQGADMSIVLLLPSDDVSISERSQALALWCQGFLNGFGLIVQNQALSSEAREVLQDMAAIAQMQEIVDDSEEAESNYMQLMEYLRVAPLLLFSEFAKHTRAVSNSVH